MARQKKVKEPEKPREDAFTLKSGGYRFFIKRSAEPSERGIDGSRIYVMLISGWDDEGRYGSIMDYDHGWEGSYDALDEDTRSEIEEVVYKYGWEGYEDQRKD